MSPWRLLGFLIIATIAVLVYYPSLWHAPRSDQIVYFFVTANRHGWASLALSCFDLNRWGTFAAGDERLFRPLVYFFLGTEKYLFGYNFWLWQAMGVFLHLTVIWFLMKLLWRIVPGKPAFACTLFFAVLLMNMEMVIWTHIHSYLIFVIALLIVLDRVYLIITTGKEDQGKNMIVIALSFLVAGFIYETANIFSVIVAIFLIKKRSSWIIFIPPLLYFILDAMNFKAHHIVSGMQSPDFIQVFNNVIVAWGFWIDSVLWPGLVEIYFDARNMVTEGSFDLWLCYFWAIAVLSVIAVRCRRLEVNKRNFIFLIMVMLFFYALVIVVGRGQEQGISRVLIRNTHYFYPFWALMVIVAGILIGAVKSQRIQTALVCALLVLSLVNAVKLYQINEIQAKAGRATILLAHSVEGLIEEKKNEKDFSFYVPADYPGNYAYSDGQGHKSSFIGMLFPQYFKENMPKYIFIAH